MEDGEGGRPCGASFRALPEDSGARCEDNDDDDVVVVVAEDGVTVDLIVEEDKEEVCDP